MLRSSVATTPPFQAAPYLTQIFTALVAASLATSTLKSYKSHEKAFLSFCQGHNVADPFPLALSTLLGFIAFYLSLDKTYNLCRWLCAPFEILLGASVNALKFSPTL